MRHMVGVMAEPAAVAGSRRTLAKILGDRIRFQARMVPAGHLSFVLDGPSAVDAGEGDALRVLPFLEAQGLRYWIGVQLKFIASRGDSDFLSASIVIFQGALANAAKNRVLRAEWERSRASRPGPHAQPHWHVYMSVPGSSRPEPVTTLELAGDDGIVGGESRRGAHVAREMAMTRFHLAMAARWHIAGLEAEDAIYQAPTDDNVAEWIGNCVEYTRRQLSYVSDKSPSA
jgi:hypothetical protein